MPYAYFFYNFGFSAGPSGSMKGPAGPTGSGSAYRLFLLMRDPKDRNFDASLFYMFISAKNTKNI